MIEIITGVGIICFLLFYFTFKLDETHVILKYFTIIFCIGLFFFIPKSMIDFSDNNYLVEINETESGNTTTYTYDYQPPAHNRNTIIFFYEALVFYVIMFFIYIFMYLQWLWWLEGLLINWAIIKKKKNNGKE